MYLTFLITACLPTFPIQNFPPVLSSVSPADGSIVNYQESTLFSIQVSDQDTTFDAIQIRLESDIDGLFIQESPDDAGTLNQSYAGLSVGEHLITVSVRDDMGNAINETYTLFVNAIPEISGVMIRPESPKTTDDLEVYVLQSSDLDGDTVQLQYRWYKNGELQDELDTAVLDASYTQKDDIWSVDVTPLDDEAQGATQSTSTVILNTIPEIDSLTITPAEEVTLDTELRCDSVGRDADDDAFDSTYTWRILSNGNFYDAEYNGPTFTPEAPLVQPGDQVLCASRLREADGTLSEAMQSSITVANRAPEIQDVLVYVPSGEPVRSGATLECYTEVSDPDQSTVLIDYVWYNGTTVLKVDSGRETTQGSQISLTDTNSARGDSIICQVTASDPHGAVVEGQSAGDEVVNTAPVLSSIGISPLVPTSQDSIACLPVSTDIDGDTLSHEFVWTVNGNVTQTGSSDTLAGPFSSNDEVTCSVTPTDGQTFDGTGNSLSATVTVQNTAPVVLDVSFSPESVTVNDVLVASVTASDLDSDDITLHYEWFVEGSSVKSGLGNSLDGQQYFLRNHQIYVAVTPSDAQDSGQTITSDIITVENAAPTLGGAEILPENPTPTVDDLVCTLNATPSDVDGDDVDVSITWTNNGVLYTDGTNQAVYPNDTIPAAFTRDGDQWVCTVEASDNTLSTTVDSDPLDVLCLNGYGDISSCAANSCLEILEERPLTYSEDGTYWLNPEGDNPYEAYCDMTHDGGGWTLVLKTTGSATDLYYNALYWESEALLGTSYLYPNEDETGESSKFAAYNSVVGSTLRMEFVTPTEWNIHHYNLGLCSDGVSMLKEDCETAGTCSDATYSDQANCESNGICSDATYTTEQDCVDAGESWSAHTWTPAAWDDGLSALSLFQGGEILIQGSETPSGCPGGLLIQDFSDQMKFAEGPQFFGINGYNLNVNSTWSSIRHVPRIRFGYGSYSYSSSIISWRPQIGIGTYDYHRWGLAGFQAAESSYSTIWLDASHSSSCAFYGNGLGAAAEDAASNLWIR